MHAFVLIPTSSLFLFQIQHFQRIILPPHLLVLVCQTTLVFSSTESVPCMYYSLHHFRLGLSTVMNRACSTHTNFVTVLSQIQDFQSIILPLGDQLLHSHCIHTSDDNKRKGPNKPSAESTNQGHLRHCNACSH